MNLLILTQRVDNNDPILGFFVEWIRAFSKKYNNVIVICLEKGKYVLPENVQVFSLGKEGGVSRIKYVRKFFKYIWQFRKQYNSVFVHMNGEYMLLGGIVWKILGKRAFMWRNHKSGGWKARLAVMLSDKVFYTSDGSYTAQFKNALQMPVGINRELFRPIAGVERAPNSYLYIGRISPIKNIDKMIDGFIAIAKKSLEHDFHFDLVGPVDSELDIKYKKELEGKIARAGLVERIKFTNAVPQAKLPELYSSHQFCINLTASGSFDKTIWESVFCGCIPIVHNTSFLNEIPENIRTSLGVVSLESESVAQTFKRVQSINSVEVSKTLMQIGKKHSLENLIEKLAAII